MVLFFVSGNRLSKHSSRIAACQVMYQKDLMCSDTEKTVYNFVNHYIKEEPLLKNINMKFFKKLISHFDEILDFEEIISQCLVNDGSVTSIPAVMKSIIKVAILELKFEKTDIPVIINEYVNVSKYFVDKSSVNFINAVLDRIAKKMERLCLKEQ